MTVDYCWSLQIITPESAHSRKYYSNELIVMKDFILKTGIIFEKTPSLHILQSEAATGKGTFNMKSARLKHL